MKLGFLPKLTFALLLGLSAFSLLAMRSTFATSLGIANYIPISDSEVKDGDIVSSSSGGFYLSKYPYDSAIVGVVSTDPAILFQNALSVGDVKRYPVVLSGTAKVNVSSGNGPIRKGDVVTSSSVPGVGMRADKSGYALGVALEDYDSPDPSQVGKIDISLNMRFFYPGAPFGKAYGSGFFGALISTAYQSPEAAFKYLAAGVLVLLSFVLGLVYFGRIASSGVEALGRNPLASRTIQLGIVVNVAITVAIIMGGSAVALLILRL